MIAYLIFDITNLWLLFNVAGSLLIYFIKCCLLFYCFCFLLILLMFMVLLWILKVIMSEMSMWGDSQSIIDYFYGTYCNPECQDTVQEWSCVKNSECLCWSLMWFIDPKLCRTVGCFPLLKAFWYHKSNTQLSEQIKFRASKACVQREHCLLQQGPNNFISGIISRCGGTWEN